MATVERRSQPSARPSAPWQFEVPTRRSILLQRAPAAVESGLAASTIIRPCAAFRYANRLADLEPPTNCVR
jgi:hypothetical protein